MKHTTTVLLLCALLGHGAAFANANTWKPPKTIVEYCTQLGKDITNSYNNMIEHNRLGLAEQNDQKRRDLFAHAGLYKDSMLQFQDQWSKMNCALILYGK